MRKVLPDVIEYGIGRNVMQHQAADSDYRIITDLHVSAYTSIGIDNHIIADNRNILLPISLTDQHMMLDTYILSDNCVTADNRSDRSVWEMHPFSDFCLHRNITSIYSIKYGIEKLALSGQLP